MPTLSLSLIVPMYNEAARISAPLREMAGYLAQQSLSAEIVLVDDGSTDGTADVVANVAETLDFAVRLVRYPHNRGKGFALKVGVDAAQGEYLVFTDCDLSTPIDELPRFLAALNGADIAIGTRKGDGAELVRRQPWLREKLGMVFTMIVRILIAPVTDATCGFKAFKRDVGKDLFARQRIEDWSFDAELLLNARRRGYRLVELPVRWQDCEGTKVRLLRDIAVTSLGIVKIRLFDMLGRYDRVVPVGAYSQKTFGGAAVANVKCGNARP
ncbi:MAG: glycosyltransferase family 2 protein [Deltaproteobacteria bacterium]|nr:glycosyltransferase family 2 protein [Deltaproteobacteria bacterium]MBW2724680.1 glycosyltransferase family 2 protein [Deltaproteobacteria bacterium]